MNSTYPDQKKICADHLYLAWCGYYLLVEVNRDLFGYITRGFHAVRPIDYAEVLTLRLTPGQALLLVPGDYAI